MSLPDGSHSRFVSLIAAGIKPHSGSAILDLALSASPGAGDDPSSRLPVDHGGRLSLNETHSSGRRAAGQRSRTGIHGDSA